MIATLDEFLDWEDEQLDRYEFLDGAVRRKTGGTEDLDRLSVNQITLLATALRGGRCSVHGSNLKVVSRASNASIYPELFVRCGPRGGRRTWIDDAVVVVEVLSPRIAKDDLTRKRRAYTSLATMRTVVYVSQDEARLDVVRRQADGSFSLAIAEIYEDTLVARAADRA